MNFLNKFLSRKPEEEDTVPSEDEAREAAHEQARSEGYGPEGYGQTEPSARTNDAAAPAESRGESGNGSGGDAPSGDDGPPRRPVAPPPGQGMDDGMAGGVGAGVTVTSALSVVVPFTLVALRV